MLVLVILANTDQDALQKVESGDDHEDNDNGIPQCKHLLFTDVYRPSLSLFK